jgi:hypothetical protein
MLGNKAEGSEVFIKPYWDSGQDVYRTGCPTWFGLQIFYNKEAFYVRDSIKKN